MTKSSALLFHRHGLPSEVIELGEVEIPALRVGDVRVRMILAPINPADLNVIEGTYPLRPSLPGVPGGEGVAVIEEIGAEVEGLSEGDRVLLPHGVGTWRQMAIVPAEQLIRVPSEIADEQAAMLRINPATAFRMLADFVDLKPGDWVVQNVANSGVGRAVIEIAHQRGIRTVNVVRRAELIEELKQHGADIVLVDSEQLVDEIAEATEEGAPRLGLNAVGGESALRIANVLASGGIHVTYGAMGRKPVRIPNGLLIFKDVSFRGFWVTRWYQQATIAERDEMFAELFALAGEGLFRTPVQQCFRLGDFKEALALAAEGGRNGKVVFAPQAK